MKTLWKWFVELDQVLRGERTRLADLRDAKIKIPLRGMGVVLVLLGMFYGVCMGCYAVVNFERGEQMLASVVKVPALFLLTLAVTLPSLYVFNALVGSRLTANSILRLFVAALGVNVAVLASLGPIVAFFSLNTTSYHFMVLLNVLVFAVSGILSVKFLQQTLHRMNIAPYIPPMRSYEIPPEISSTEDHLDPEIVDAVVVEPGSREESGPLDRLEGYVLGQHVRTVFSCWMILFGVVGAQMSWVLRPFIGSPNQEFEWFRPRGSNFFESVFKSLVALFS